MKQAYWVRKGHRLEYGDEQFTQSIDWGEDLPVLDVFVEEIELYRCVDEIRQQIIAEMTFYWTEEDKKILELKKRLTDILWRCEIVEQFSRSHWILGPDKIKVIIRAQQKSIEDLKKIEDLIEKVIS